MIILQIVVGVLNARKKRGLTIAQSTVPENEAQNIPVSDEEIKLLVSHVPDVVKEVLKQEQEKE